jgi:hypothetical protein
MPEEKKEVNFDDEILILEEIDLDTLQQIPKVLR